MAKATREGAQQRVRCADWRERARRRKQQNKATKQSKTRDWTRWTGRVDKRLNTKWPQPGPARARNRNPNRSRSRSCRRRTRTGTGSETWGESSARRSGKNLCSRWGRSVRRQLQFDERRKEQWRRQRAALTDTLPVSALPISLAHTHTHSYTGRGAREKNSC